MKNRLIISLTFLFATVSWNSSAQEFYPFWEGVEMPNSRGLHLKDSIANERVYQIGIPGIYGFFPSEAENKRAAVLIIPGGGYARLAYEISGFQLAKWFNTFGVTAFVLFHRFPQSPDVVESHKAPLQDAQRAMRYIRSRAGQWNIDPARVGAMGSSAGGHLSACLSTIKEDWSSAGDAIDNFPYRPDFTILISPVITMDERYVHKGSRDNLIGKEPSVELAELFSCEKQVAADTPPAFLVHAANDRGVPAVNSVLYYNALLESGNERSSLHIFPSGGHAISLRDNPGTTAWWPFLAEKWLDEIGMLK